jgi:cupin fold WbuC family metalloprotein
MDDRLGARFKQVQPEVLYPVEPIVHLDRQDVTDLVALADRNPRRRIRICAHGDASDGLHEMFIVHVRGTYVRPHKHLGKSESFHVVEGEADVVLFDEQGSVVRVIRMGPYASGGTFYYRLSEPLYHTLLIRSDTFVFHEVTRGPFDRSQTVFAPWSPPDDQRQAADDFMQHLTQIVGK